MKRLVWIAWCWLAIAAGPALAQDRGVSYSTWIVTDKVVTLRYVLPVAEAQRLTGAEVPLLTSSRLEGYLLQHLAVHSAGGECPAIDQGFDLGRVDPLAVGPEFYGFEIFFRCSDPRQLVLRNSALFAGAPGHVDFASIQRRGRSAEQLFTAEQQSLALPEDGTVPSAGSAAYLRLGMGHVMRNANRWCFVLGLLLLLRRRRDLGFLILALTGGYLLALLLATTGWVLPRLTPLESFMGFLVALLGAVLSRRELLRERAAAAAWPSLLLLLVLSLALLRAPSAMFALLGAGAIGTGVLALSGHPEGRVPIWLGLVALFGILDGFALPAVLPPAHLPQRLQLQLLIGFDLGALLIESLLLGLAVAAWLLLRARRRSQPPQLLHDVCAAGLSGLGAFWLLSRTG